MKRPLHRIAMVLTAILLLAVGYHRCVASPDPTPTASSASPPRARSLPPDDAATLCPDHNDLKNVYFGDLHVHTGYSLDAYATGARADPASAYAFARGAKIRVAEGAPTPGDEVEIDRSLDFMAVTDHSEFLGPIGLCTLDPSADGYDASYCQAIRKTGSTAAKVTTYGSLMRLMPEKPEDPMLCRGTDERRERCRRQAQTLWKKTQDAANAAYERCSFTTFKAYEWSGQLGRANLHRNVIFSGDVVPDIPFDAIRYPAALALWQALDRECRSRDGCDVITIPHNSNASAGQMWDTADDPQAVPFMRRYQVLAEFFQHKGSGECMPDQALGDPDCAFELIPGSAIADVLGLPQSSDEAAKNVRAYARNGLARGLELSGKETKNNPLRFGFVGSTDTHNASPGNVREDSWPGHTGGLDVTPKKRLESPNLNPGGLAAVWAEENSREAIFAALKRRETYATSGPRMTVRMYVAPEVTDEAAARAMCDDASFPRALIDAGAVPMGGTFKGRQRPFFFVHALQDTTPLARVDLVKISTDDAGKATSSVQAIPLSEAQQHRACVFWSDQTFDSARPSLYYARVLEQPTWRWSHYDCQRASGVKGCEKGGGLDVKIQERAWTSPVYAELAFEPSNRE